MYTYKTYIIIMIISSSHIFYEYMNSFVTKDCVDRRIQREYEWTRFTLWVYRWPLGHGWQMAEFAHGTEDLPAGHGSHPTASPGGSPGSPGKVTNRHEPSCYTTHFQYCHRKTFGKTESNAM